MATAKLDHVQISAVREALARLKGKARKQRALELAGRFAVSYGTICRLTQDLNARKKRSDAGRRAYSIDDHEGLSFAAEQAIVRKVCPMDALEMARRNGHETPISEGTFVRYLAEKGMTGKNRKKITRAFRRWEASQPCELFQFDITGLKLRWLDLKTRKLLKIAEGEIDDKNHPNANPNRVRVWAFCLIDDYSRYVFIRFRAVDKPSSVDVIDFLLEAYREMGVPLKLYTDNDAVIVSKLGRRAERILNAALAESGGYKLEQHTPNNPQATGKVERLHQTVERLEKLIGAHLDLNGGDATIELINQFAANLCEKLNHTPHSSTGARPVERWRNDFSAKRIPPPATLDAAFKCRELDPKFNHDYTINIEGTRYQLPREKPFSDFLGNKVRVVWPHSADAPAVALFPPYAAFPRGAEIEFERRAAGAHAAGEFKAVPESLAEQTLKKFTAQAKARKKALRETGEQVAIQGVNVPFEIQERRKPIEFPKPVTEISAAKLAELAPGAMPAAAHGGERWLGYYSALRELIAEGVFERESESFDSDCAWLRGLFGAREELSNVELRAALEERGGVVEHANVLQFRRTG